MVTLDVGAAETTAPAAPASYGELVEVLDLLPVLIREARRRRGLTMRDAAAEIGVSISGVSRWEARVGEPDLASTIKVLRWLAR